MLTAEGQVLDNTYRIVRLVAEGGMGLVYEATHARLAGRYAIKVLPQKWSKDPEAMARFDREARITSSLQHPNIVQIIDFNTSDDGTEYLVMEYLQGETLAARLTRVGPLSLDTVVTIVEQLASGLAAAHSHGIVHRDLKPENVLLLQVEGREGEWAKILDFGISKVNDASLGTIDPVNKSLIGTPQYMAPEQCEGRTTEVDAATDQFALAAITYEMLTGRRPFAGESLGEVLFRVLQADPPPMNVGPRLESIVRRALAKSRRDRYPSVTAFAEALRAAASGLGHRQLVNQVETSGSHAYAVGEIDRMYVGPRSRRRHWGAVVVTAAVITVAAAFVVRTASTSQATAPAPSSASAALSAPVGPATPTMIAQPTPAPVPVLAPIDEGPSELSGDSRAELVVAPAAKDGAVPAVPAVPAARRVIARRSLPMGRESAARTPAAVAWTPTLRTSAPATRASGGRATTAPARQQATPEPTAGLPRRDRSPVSAPEATPSRPPPADDDAILPLDETFNNGR